MNLGQVLNEYGGVNEELELPNFSVLALEARRHPNTGAWTVDRQYSLSDRERSARTERLPKMEKPETETIQRQLLAVLRCSSGAGEKLSSSEVLKRAGLKSSSQSVWALRDLRKSGAVRIEGIKRGTVYVGVQETECKIAAASS